MEVLVRNAEGNLSPRDREYAAKKLGRLERYFNQANKVEIVHREEKQAHRIEITVFADGLTVRGEEVDTSVRAAIDRVSDKLETRLLRLKSRIVDRNRRKGDSVPAGFMTADKEAEPPAPVIKERKTFLLHQMSREEAALQMEMIDHPFYIFRSEETGQIEVLYKRKDGNYGLLQPEI